MKPDIIIWAGVFDLFINQTYLDSSLIFLFGQSNQIISIILLNSQQKITVARYEYKASTPIFVYITSIYYDCLC